MKNIYFLRHAKSSWDDFALKDFDRPLSTRGIQDADLMGNYFRSKKIKLDIVFSSPSKRTRETLEHFFQLEKPSIKFEESIYHASLDQLLSVIFGTPENLNNIMVVGHNPSMHEITEYLGNIGYLGNNGFAFGINEFGKSAPYKDIYKYFGLESTNIKNITKKLLKK